MEQDKLEFERKRERMAFVRTLMFLLDGESREDDLVTIGGLKEILCDAVMEMHDKGWIDMTPKRRGRFDDCKLALSSDGLAVVTSWRNELVDETLDEIWIKNHVEL